MAVADKNEEIKDEALEEILEDLEKETQEKKAEAEAETAQTEKAAEECTQETAAAEEQKNPDAEEAGSDTKEHEKDGRKFFQKKTREDKKTDVLNEKIAELEDKSRRQLAEFENFRKRTEKEKETMFEAGAKNVIEKILPVVDNFERGLATVPETEANSAFVEGMQKIYRQLVTELDNLGVKPIEAVGVPFDPNLHNAVMQTESEELESGMVAQELQKGYTYRDSVVRHSMVSVVQ